MNRVDLNLMKFEIEENKVVFYFDEVILRMSYYLHLFEEGKYRYTCILKYNNIYNQPDVQVNEPKMAKLKSVLILYLLKNLKFHVHFHNNRKRRQITTTAKTTNSIRL